MENIISDKMLYQKNKQGLPLVFFVSVHFLNNSLENLVKNLAENKKLSKSI